jgi:hypothetical protein
MDMADGNFTTNHTLLGKKNGSEHDDRNDRFVFPLGRPRPGFILLYLTSLILIRLKPRKFILNIGQPKPSLLVVRVLAYIMCMAKLKVCGQLCHTV